MSDTQRTEGKHGRGTTGVTVDAFLERLEHPQLAAIRLLRAAILSADPRIYEAVKWNAPSFALEEHFATFKLRPVETVQIVLHTGAKVRPTPVRITLDDPTGLLVWVAPDRAVITFAGLEAASASQAALVAVVQQWVAQLEGGQ
jgi:hypothetical protein